jgi:hypothetical protein
VQEVNNDQFQNSFFGELTILSLFLFSRTFIWVTLGFTFATFVLGGLSWWVPLYVTYAIQSKNEVPEEIPLLFGVVTCVSGLFGVAVSSLISPG